MPTTAARPRHLLVIGCGLGMKPSSPHWLAPHHTLHGEVHDRLATDPEICHCTCQSKQSVEQLCALKFAN